MAVKNHLWRNISLKTIIFFTVISTIILQAFIAIFLIIRFNVAGQLDKSNIQTISNTVSFRSNSLGQTFSRFMDLEEYYHALTTLVEKTADGQNPSEYFSDAISRRKFLKNCVPILTSSLRDNDTTAIFMVLDDGSGQEYLDGIYIRDYDPHTNKLDDSDLCLEFGPRSVAEIYGFSCDTLWTEKIDVVNQMSFYQTVVEAANANPDLDALSLGYFSLPCQIHEGDLDMIAYCVPLMDEHHHCYGVIGYAMTVEYFKSQISFQEISTHMNGTYMVALSQDVSLTPILFSNDGTLSFLSNQSLTVYPRMENYHLYDLYCDTLPSNLSVFQSKLDFMSQSSPYTYNNWVLCCIVENDGLYAASNYLHMVLLCFIIGIVLIGILVVFLLYHFILDPISSLLKDVQELRPGFHYLEKTRVKEFDELAKAIEASNVSVYQSGNKIVDILDSSKILLGILEFSELGNSVFCTKSIFEILSINGNLWKNNYIDKAIIIHQLERRRQCFRQSHDDPELYLYRCPNLEDKWLRIVRITNADNTIITFSDVTKEQLEKEQLLKERDFDVLTNLYNRRAFAREMEKLIDDRGVTNGILSIWDLDNLKFTNDNYGHDSGDKYIQLLGNIISQKLPVSSVSARLAGDEFTLFLYGATNDELLFHLKCLHNNLLHQQLKMKNNEVINVSASVGVAYFDDDGNTYKDLLRFADFAMYEVKKSSKGNVKKFDHESYLKNYILVQGVGELERIIAEQAIQYYFQPIYSMETKSVFAYEALIRPVSDLLSSPDNLLKVAQNQSKLGQIEKITWFLALRHFYSQIHSDDNAKLFINSIPNQLLSDEDFAKLETEFGADLSRIVLEITETMQSENMVDKKKRAFCDKWNIPIALDDFGAGYSNGDMLVTRPFNYIKIDRSLVHNIHKSSSMQVFVSGIITFCHENGQLVIAEGIETEEEYQIMRGLGADYAQGYFLRKPNISLY